MQSGLKTQFLLQSHAEPFALRSGGNCVRAYAQPTFSDNTVIRFTLYVATSRGPFAPAFTVKQLDDDMPLSPLEEPPTAAELYLQTLKLLGFRLPGDCLEVIAALAEPERLSLAWDIVTWFQNRPD